MTYYLEIEHFGFCTEFKELPEEREIKDAINEFIDANL